MSAVLRVCLSFVLAPTLALALAGACSRAAAADIRGTLTLVSKAGKPMAADELSDAVVSFEPATPAAAAVAAAPAPAVMTTRGKAFLPRVVAVTAGSSVSFPNEDPILHNAFSVSPGNAFDAGLYGKGEGVTRTFPQPGVTRIFCNVHQSMVGYVVVLGTPHFTRPSPDGSFALTGLPDGPGRLVAWHPLTETWSQDLAGATEAPSTIRLQVTQKKVPPHLDKLGKPYEAKPADYE